MNGADFATSSASSTARPSGVSTTRAASRSIRPRTNIAISVAPVTPACAHSLPDAIQNSSMRSGVERLEPMSGAPFIAGRSHVDDLCTTKLRPHLITNVQRGAALELSMEYTVTAAFLLAVVTGSFAIVILGGYEIAQLVASAL